MRSILSLGIVRFFIFCLSLFVCLFVYVLLPDDQTNMPVARAADTPQSTPGSSLAHKRPRSRVTSSLPHSILLCGPWRLTMTYASVTLSWEASGLSFWPQKVPREKLIALKAKLQTFLPNGSDSRLPPSGIKRGKKRVKTKRSRGEKGARCSGVSLVLVTGSHAMLLTATCHESHHLSGVTSMLSAFTCHSTCRGTSCTLLPSGNPNHSTERIKHLL